MGHPRKAVGWHSFPGRVAAGSTIPQKGKRVHVLGIRMALPTGGHGLVRSRGCLSKASGDTYQSAGISSN